MARKILEKKRIVGQELVQDAAKAREAGCTYGQLKQRQWSQAHAGELKAAIAIARADKGYLSMRERKEIQKTANF